MSGNTGDYFRILFHSKLKPQLDIVSFSSFYKLPGLVSNVRYFGISPDILISYVFLFFREDKVEREAFMLKLIHQLLKSTGLKSMGIK